MLFYVQKNRLEAIVSTKQTKIQLDFDLKMIFDGLIWITRFQYDSVNILGPTISVWILGFFSMKPSFQVSSFGQKGAEVFSGGHPKFKVIFWIF